MLNFVICDDDIRLINRLCSLLEKVFIQNDFDAKIAFTTTDYNKLLDFTSKYKVHAIFLDIEFSGQTENGLTIAEKIREINKRCYLIFVTSHFEYIAEAYKYKTFDYIFKSSIDLESITSTVTRLFDDVSNSNTTFIKIDNKNTLIDINDIQFIEKDGVRLIYHTYNSRFVTYNSFNKLHLPDNFVRCHKSFIVNIQNISTISLSDNTVYFKNGSICYIGPKYKNSFLEVIDYDTVS